MSFGMPLLLLAFIPLVGVAVALAWQGKRWQAASRLLIGSLLTVAMADPGLSRDEALERVVYVVDTSESIPESARQQAIAAIEQERKTLPPKTRTAVVQVDGTARVVQAPGPATSPLPDLLPPSDRTGTALAEGLSLASALLPDRSSGRVVVFTDGAVDSSSLDTILEQLDARGIQLTAVPPELPPPPADLLTLSLPSAADVGSTVRGTLAIRGGPDGLSTEARVELVGPGGAITPLDPIQLRAPPNEERQIDVILAIPPALPSGLYAVRTTAPSLEPMQRGLRIDRPPEVLVVSGTSRDGRVLRGVLEADGLAVTEASASSPPALTEDLDLVVLAGPPTRGSGALPADWVATLGPFVEQGGGVLTISGPNAYASGGWQDSALAPLLPVRIDPDGAEKDDSAALLVVLDKSGSMARPAADARSPEGMVASVADIMVGGRSRGSKIQVAAEAAAATMSRLRDHDRVGVLAVDTLPYWPVPFTDARNRADAQAKVRRISAGGGGMYVLTALEEASKAMAAEEAPLRHILMLIDASDAGEQTQDVYGDVRNAVEVARSLRAEGITISVVGIGSTTSRDSPFLRTLTNAGGGRLKLTPDIRTVSSLFTQEVERLVGSATTEQAPVRVQVTGWHPALQGVDMARAPQLHGWSDVLPRPEARTVLATPEGTPIFAVWNRGLGQVAAWTSDDGARWAKGWPAWSDSAHLWTQLARDLARSQDATDSPLQLEARSGAVDLTLRALASSARPMVVGSPEVAVEVDGQPVAPPELRLVAPGTVRGTIHAAPGARVSVVARSTSAGGPEALLGEDEVIVHASSERANRGRRTDVLDRLERSPAVQSTPGQRPVPLWPWLVLLAVVLLPADAYARRFGSPTPH